MAATSFSLILAAETARADGVAHRFEPDVLAEFGARLLDRGLGEWPTRVVHHRCLHRGATDIQSNEISFRGHEPTPREMTR